MAGCNSERVSKWEVREMLNDYLLLCNIINTVISNETANKLPIY